MPEDEEKREQRGFTVQDRRRFSPETGEPRADVHEAKEGAGVSAGPDTAGEEPSSAKAESLSEISFSTFVISLSTQALMHLGEIASPIGGKVEQDIPLAKHMIDILGMLRDKTRGNLNQGEEKLMEDILFDLRMKYVEAVKKR